MFVSGCQALFAVQSGTNMRLAIMQPYFFPYIGYFQLIQAADAFVVYDDVNFIKGGWINRNFILVQGDRARITLQLKGASPNVLINQIEVGGNGRKLLKSIEQAYSRAPQYLRVFPIIEDILTCDKKNLALYLSHGLQRICSYLGLFPNWYMSSQINKDNDLRGQKKVLAICEQLGSTHYINMPGGKALYDRETFVSHDIQLSFIQQKPLSYRQFGKEFVPNLSIIDVMMFNDQESCAQLLQEYSLD